jgi:hypothetical protein
LFSLAGRNRFLTSFLRFPHGNCEDAFRHCGVPSQSFISGLCGSADGQLFFDGTTAGIRKRNVRPATGRNGSDR